MVFNLVGQLGSSGKMFAHVICLSTESPPPSHFLGSARDFPIYCSLYDSLAHDSMYKSGLHYRL